MSQELILKFLAGRGECAFQEIQIEGLNKRSVAGYLTRLTAAKRLSRREIKYKNRTMWAYTLVGEVPREPEHYFILRNLARKS